MLHILNSRIWGSLTSIAAAAAFAAAVILFTNSVVVRIPLFVQFACPHPPCLTNTPGLPVVPLLAGIAYVLVLVRVPPVRAAAWGLGLGIVAAGSVGLARTAAIPFGNEYFGLPYRLYAVGYVGAVTFLTATAVARFAGESSPRGAAARALLAVLAGTALQQLGERSLPIGGTLAVALGAGIAASRWRPLALAMPREHAVLIAVVTIAFAFRAIFGLQALARTGPGMAFALGSDDGDAYYKYAVAIAADLRNVGDVLAGNAGFPPAYSGFLATIFALTRESLAAVIVAQAALGAAATLLIQRIARPLLGAAAALIAAALFAFDGNIVQNGSTLTAEAILIPLTLFGLWALIRYHASARARWLLAAAAAFGIAFVTRNNILVALGAAIGWSAFVTRREPLRMVRDVAVFAAAILIAAAPVAVATAAREGTPRLTNQLASTTWENEDEAGIAMENGFLNRRGINPFRDLGGSLRVIVSDPLPVLGFLAIAAPQRVGALLFSVEPGVSDPVTIVNPAVLPTTYGDLVKLVLAASLLVGAIRYVIRRPAGQHDEITLIVAYTAAYIALFAFVFPPRQAFRYRIPVEPFAFMCEAVGLLLIARALLGIWSDRRTR